jgi:hypothetical protein
MLSFIRDSKLADCDMTALGVAQQLQPKVGADSKIIIGNQPMTPRVLDIKTANHAWNLWKSEGGKDG